VLVGGLLRVTDSQGLPLVWWFSHPQANSSPTGSQRPPGLALGTGSIRTPPCSQPFPW